MTNEILILTATAFSIGFAHTILGPDHYLPFVAMAKARNWSFGKTLKITAWCGVGHVAGSFVLGLLGLFLGTVLMELEWIESLRGDIAAWSLILFGLAYFLWGSRHACRPPRPQHSHHSPDHEHGGITFALLVIFLLGPCEALIPVLMYPAATAATNLDRSVAIFSVVFAFSLATIFTMMSCVACLHFGLQNWKLHWLHRYHHAIAGLTILLCGILIQVGL